MGTKLNPAPNDCYTKAEPDEPMFTLLARDPDAPDLVREWARRRASRPLGHGDWDKIREANTLAAQMDTWRAEHRP